MCSINWAVCSTNCVCAPPTGIKECHFHGTGLCIEQSRRRRQTRSPSPSFPWECQTYEPASSTMAVITVCSDPISLRYFLLSLAEACPMENRQRTNAALWHRGTCMKHTLFRARSLSESLWRSSERALFGVRGQS
jgi:hypothetical protein